MPLVVLLGERLAAPERSLRSRDWLLVALFAIGASDAKIALLPLILAALVAVRRLVVGGAAPPAAGAAAARRR